MPRIACKIAEIPAELAAYYTIRQAVFVDEQGMFHGTDVDERDAQAIHIVAVDEETGSVVGGVRCYFDPEWGEDTWFGGRLTVRQDYRHKGAQVGPLLVRAAERAVQERGCRCFLAHIQVQNVKFFERLGWHTVGEPQPLHGFPHQMMEAHFSWLNRNSHIADSVSPIADSLSHTIK